MTTKHFQKKIPDISNDTVSQHPVKLEKVGMENIELPILIESNGKIIHSPAKINIFINLNDPIAKGIHMSRLFLIVQEYLTSQVISSGTILQLLKKCVQTHSKLANEAFLKIQFDYFTERNALLSKNKGWKAYPVCLQFHFKNNKLTSEYSVTASYSSTCPCSAALARQDVQNTFLIQHPDQTKFSKEEIFEWLGKESSVSATPHAQRSKALVKVKQPKQNFPILTIINLIEDTLQTATQATVKREDEQEFARLNGRNLMFCEDAAKKLKIALDKNDLAEDFYIKVRHFESLHPHDATAIAVKNVNNGYQA